MLRALIFCTSLGRNTICSAIVLDSRPEGCDWHDIAAPRFETRGTNTLQERDWLAGQIARGNIAIVQCAHHTRRGPDTEASRLQE